MAYAEAHGTTTGYVTGKHTAPSPNLFKTGENIYLMDYQFRGPDTPTFGKPAPPPPASVPADGGTVYKAVARISEAFHASVEAGQTVPVKYDATDPVISGVTLDGAGMNNEGGANILSIWIAFDLAILVVAYPVAMLLERVMLRESY